MIMINKKKKKKTNQHQLKKIYVVLGLGKLKNVKCIVFSRTKIK